MEFKIRLKKRIQRPQITIYTVYEFFNDLAQKLLSEGSIGRFFRHPVMKDYVSTPAGLHMAYGTPNKGRRVLNHHKTTFYEGRNKIFLKSWLH